MVSNIVKSHCLSSSLQLQIILYFLFHKYEFQISLLYPASLSSFLSSVLSFLSPSPPTSSNPRWSSAFPFILKQLSPIWPVEVSPGRIIRWNLGRRLEPARNFGIRWTNIPHSIASPPSPLQVARAIIREWRQDHCGSGLIVASRPRLRHGGRRSWNETKEKVCVGHWTRIETSCRSTNKNMVCI